MICSGASKSAATLLALAALAALTLISALGCASTAATSRVDLTNPFLGPEYTSWLVGAIARLATKEEIDAYLALHDDEAARQFVEAFWAKRDSNGDHSGNPLWETFENRSAQADKSFTESGFAGRRTDRGATFILYGAPKKVDYEVPPLPGENPIEVWLYDESSPTGLDGRKPGTYRFIRRGDLTVRYVPGRPDPRARLRNDPTMPPPDIP